jgi:hypothetical protein
MSAPTPCGSVDHSAIHCLIAAIRVELQAQLTAYKDAVPRTLMDWHRVRSGKPTFLNFPRFYFGTILQQKPIFKTRLSTSQVSWKFQNDRLPDLSPCRALCEVAMWSVGRPSQSKISRCRWHGRDRISRYQGGRWSPQLVRGRGWCLHFTERSGPSGAATAKGESCLASQSQRPWRVAIALPSVPFARMASK